MPADNVHATKTFGLNNQTWNPQLIDVDKSFDFLYIVKLKIIKMKEAIKCKMLGNMSQKGKKPN